VCVRVVRWCEERCRASAKKKGGRGRLVIFFLRLPRLCRGVALPAAATAAVGSAGGERKNHGSACGCDSLAPRPSQGANPATALEGTGPPCEKSTGGGGPCRRRPRRSRRRRGDSSLPLAALFAGGASERKGRGDAEGQPSPRAAVSHAAASHPRGSEGKRRLGRERGGGRPSAPLFFFKRAPRKKRRRRRRREKNIETYRLGVAPLGVHGDEQLAIGGGADGRRRGDRQQRGDHKGAGDHFVGVCLFFFWPLFWGGEERGEARRVGSEG
jgi:hypothetical protein